MSVVNEYRPFHIWGAFKFTSFLNAYKHTLNSVYINSKFRQSKFKANFWLKMKARANAAQGHKTNYKRPMRDRRDVRPLSILNHHSTPGPCLVHIVIRGKHHDHAPHATTANIIIRRHRQHHRRHTRESRRAGRKNDHLLDRAAAAAAAVMVPSSSSPGRRRDAVRRRGDIDVACVPPPRLLPRLLLADADELGK